MTDHTYAGHTAEQLRAAAMAATPGQWSDYFGYRVRMCAGEYCAPIADVFSPYRVGVGIVRGEHEQQANLRHIVMSQPATVLALLDRIAELEKQQLKMADDVAVIQRIHGEQKAGLYGRIAELEQRATRAQPAK